MEIKYDIEGLAKELEIDIEGIVGLYASYFEEMKSEITDMKEHLVKHDWKMLERVIHNIKGVSINLNISDVYSEAEKFDILLKKDVTENAGDYVDSIAHLIENAEVEIQRFFSEKGFQFNGF